MVGVARRRSLDEVRAALLPPLPLPQAVERVRKLLTTRPTADEGQPTAAPPFFSATVSLLDPCAAADTGTATPRRRITLPAYFEFEQDEGTTANPLQPFDADALLWRCERGDARAFWRCPVTGRAATFDRLRPDAYFGAVLREVGPEVEQVEVGLDGRWRVADGGGGSGGWREAGGGARGPRGVRVELPAAGAEEIATAPSMLLLEEGEGEGGALALLGRSASGVSASSMPMLWSPREPPPPTLG
jgi:hypothetical protein